MTPIPIIHRQLFILNINSVTLHVRTPRIESSENLINKLSETLFTQSEN